MTSTRQSTKAEKNGDVKNASLWLHVYWILPVFAFAVFARYTVTFPIPPIHTYPGPSVFPKQRPPGWKRSSILPLKQQQGTQAAAQPQASLSPNSLELSQQIERLKQNYLTSPDNIPIAMEYLQAMQFYEQHFSPSEFMQPLMRLYETLQQKAKQAIASSATPMLLQLLCQLYIQQGQFLVRQLHQIDEAMDRWNECLQVDPTAAQAWRTRGDAWRAMGSEYNEKAIHDYMQVLKYDSQESSSSFVLLQLSQLLKMNAPEWKTVVSKIEAFLSGLSSKTFPSAPQARYQHASTIYRLHLALMWYHLKHGNVLQAREHLQTGSRMKAASLPRWQVGAELQKVHNTRSIFRKGFWSHQRGSSTKTPIFVMGFIDSGTDLIEQHLVASHPDIVATSYSVWNQRLTEIRDQIASVSPVDLPAVVHTLAESVVQQMLGTRSAQFVVDSHWMNYYSIGLLHTIFPDALIVHVVRDPLENLVAAFMKDSSSPSEFGVLDYMCDWNVLVEIYQAYREMMQHWEEVLPGRITHVRYEDWVADPMGMATAILDRIHLPSDRVSLALPQRETGAQAFQPYSEAFDRLSDLLSRLDVYNLPFALKSQRLPKPSHLDREHVEL